jgi:uncharacterized protein (DUF2236 family)
MGYFAPESVIRRVGNSPLVPLLGGGSAVLLQVAHPLVAAGVVDHSDYRHDLWKRLLGTLRALYLITFGNKDEADRAGQAVQEVHARVHGQTRTQLGIFPAGTPYSASDPALMLWVHATLVHSSLGIYHRYVHTLTACEQEIYYQEMALVARVFGTPADVIPPSLADFRDYLQDLERTPPEVRPSSCSSSRLRCGQRRSRRTKQMPENPDEDLCSLQDRQARLVRNAALQDFAEARS